jgi:hypothetical protein
MIYPFFPAIDPPSLSPTGPLDDVYPDNRISSPADGGYVTSRPRYTRNLMGSNYVWVAMTNSDYALFNAFVQANYAYIFVWTDPITEIQTNVQFVSVPKASKALLGYWHVEISIMGA